MTFLECKQAYDKQYKGKAEIKCFLPVNLDLNHTAKIVGVDGKPNEEYYKWQFLYSIVFSGMYPKDYIGTEVSFPKGNKNSAPIKFDAAIFDDEFWLDHYKSFKENNNQSELDWLRNHLICVIEFKNEDAKDVETVYNQQLKPAMKESERDFVLGILYDTERLYLFRKQNGKTLRLNDEYNQKGFDSGTKDLTLHLPDPYIIIPKFNELLQWINPPEIDFSKRTIYDLDIISGVHSTQINDIMSGILRTMDKQGMVNQKGYEILIQILALKIFDEKRNENIPQKHLDFYITSEERKYLKLSDATIQVFIQRINKLRDDAENIYYMILQDNPLNTKNENHIRVLIEVVSQFQNYSFVRSHKTDLYQLVFYRFATPFSKDQNAQFITPLPVIDFLVNIVNPRNGETIIDPTVGIADFLSVSYVNSKSKLDDNNIYGIDIDEQMVMLATLNMLLNGDGNAKVVAKPGYGSLLSKFNTKGDLIELDPSLNISGEWDQRADMEKIKKFDVVLTNPPFGEDRAFKIKDKKDLEVIQCYELWNIARAGDWIDLGLIFLENAYRLLKEGGRLGIVLSNSIASIDRWQKAREWLMEKMRIVAIFDLPANVFAETQVSTTLIVAYKPAPNELKKLIDSDYKIFMRDIQKVGYEIRTSKRVKVFVQKYRINYSTFNIEIDSTGNPVVDEEFTNTVSDFRNWCLSQEKSLQDLFIKEK